MRPSRTILRKICVGIDILIRVVIHVICLSLFSISDEYITNPVGYAAIQRRLWSMHLHIRMCRIGNFIYSTSLILSDSPNPQQGNVVNIRWNLCITRPIEYQWTACDIQMAVLCPKLLRRPMWTQSKGIIYQNRGIIWFWRLLVKSFDEWARKNINRLQEIDWLNGLCRVKLKMEIFQFWQV